ncbi:MAG: peptidoglycan recognition family protein [Aliidongia sp.]
MATAYRQSVAAKIAEACSIIRRPDWRAKSPVRPLVYDWDYDSIVVHYTGHEHLTAPSAIQDFDIGHDHWDDIAYHYAISPEGQIYEGRELIYKGSHVKLQNTGKIGIVCMGDFDTGLMSLYWGHGYSGDPIEDTMISALRKLSQVLISTFQIHFFGGHIEYGETAVCPGNKLLPVVQAMRNDFGLATPIHREL